MPKKSAPESVTMAFRMSKPDRQWLEDTAQANGVEVSQLLRWALEALRQYVEAHDGRLHLPIDIREFWALSQPYLPANFISARLNEDSPAMASRKAPDSQQQAK